MPAARDTLDDESFAVVGRERRVEGWSSKRLPFEPKGEHLAFRAALRVALGSMRPGKGALVAVYTSPVASFCDVENVLFYNVGSSAFARLAGRGVRFRRVVADPPPAPGGRSFPHHHLYDTINDSPKVDGRSLAIWGPVVLSRPSCLEQVWLDMRRAHVERHGISSPAADNIGVDLPVTRPLSAIWTLANVMKPLLDGLVSAFHCYDGQRLDQIARVLATKLDEPVDVIRSALTDPERALLGARQLVWRRGAGLQWNPADERLVDVELRLHSGDQATCSGRLVEVQGK